MKTLNTKHPHKVNKKTLILIQTINAKPQNENQTQN